MGQMNMRKGFFVLAPKFAGAAELGEKIWFERPLIGGREQRYGALLIFKEKKRPAPFSPKSSARRARALRR